MMPVFLHHRDDTASFKMIVSQFYLNGNAKQAELVRVFGIKPLALKRWVKRYREGGPRAFFETGRKRRATPRKKPPGQPPAAPAEAPPPARREAAAPSSAPSATAVPVAPVTQSQRSREDAAAPRGVAATDECGRAMASLGKIASVPSDFRHPCESVTHGGVLFALLALLAAGLLRHAARFFTLPAGFYGLEHIFVLLGMLALCRVKSIEKLRSTAPGEWGKLLGLDRCPEAKTLRGKIKILTTQGDGKAWAARLCEDWMAANPAATATLYIDGHARAYHGHQTKLPRHYIARERLCLRATTAYWVNGLDGHQTAIISADWQAGVAQIAGPQFGRWYQENFFKYGREHFNLDRQIDYQLEAVDDTVRLVNPAWRKLDGEVRKRVATQHQRKARLHDLGISGQLEPAKAEHYMQAATALRADIEQEDAALTELKKQRKETAKHLTFAELPEEHRFLKLATRSKHFIDTIKMIAYRAETALAHIVRERINAHHQDEARALVRNLCTTPADLVPDPHARTLTLTLHSLSTPGDNAVIEHLCSELNATETIYPGTDLRMIFRSVSS